MLDKRHLFLTLSFSTVVNDKCVFCDWDESCHLMSTKKPFICTSQHENRAVPTFNKTAHCTICSLPLFLFPAHCLAHSLSLIHALSSEFIQTQKLTENPSDKLTITHSHLGLFVFLLFRSFVPREKYCLSSIFSHLFSLITSLDQVYM